MSKKKKTERSQEELAILMATQIVKSWEDIPRMVDDFCHKFGEHFRPIHDKMLREMHEGMMGGEELYEISKKFLEEREEKKGERDARPRYQLTPPDFKQCQADVPGNGPFTMGGAIGNPSNGYRVRCTNKPTWIGKEVNPGPDGLIGSMSLCDECKEVMEKKMPEHAIFAKIKEGG